MSLWWSGRIPGYADDEVYDPEDFKPDHIKDLLSHVNSCLGEVGSPTQPPIQFSPVPEVKKDGQGKQRILTPPVYFSMMNTDAPLVKETLTNNGFLQTQAHDWLIQWSGPGMKDVHYQCLHEFQKVNHFPGSTELTRKDRMWTHAQEMAGIFGKGVYDFLPETYVLPDQIEDFLKCYERTEYLWIVKPHASSRGRGIFLLRDLDDLPIDELSVVSRYIDKPLLIQGLKFDLRIYVLVTSFEPLRVYIYREGLTRFASSPYSTDEKDLDDVYKHLTNYSINKNARNFVENQDPKADNVGHKWSLSALNKHLKCCGVDVDLMWNRIMDVIIKTLLSVEQSICNRTRAAVSHRTNCFELYGFDIMIDDNVKPWLIEVNLSPSMTADSPLDRRIKSNLLTDTFNLIGVQQVDRQTVSQSRWRSRLNLLRQRSFSTLNHRTSLPGTHLSHPRGLPPRSRGQEGERRGIPIESLSEPQLRILKEVLQEMCRCHNFIPIYPTKAAIAHNAQIVSALERARGNIGRLSISSMIHSVLFGPRPRRSKSSPELPVAEESQVPQEAPSADHVEAAQADDQNVEDDLTPTSETPSGIEKVVLEESRPRSRQSSKSTAVPEYGEEASPATTSHESTEIVPSPVLRTRSPEPSGSTMDVIKALGPKPGSRLVLMEYLRRLSVICDSLIVQDKERLAKSVLFPRLSTFRHALYRNGPLKVPQTSQRPGRQRARDFGEMDGLVDELSQSFRVFLVALARDTWQETQADALSDVQVRGMAELLPQTLSQAEDGQRALSSLAKISEADLEDFLLNSSQCTQEVHQLCEGPVRAEVELAKATRRTSNPLGVGLSNKTVSGVKIWLLSELTKWVLPPNKRESVASNSSFEQKLEKIASMPYPSPKLPMQMPLDIAAMSASVVDPQRKNLSSAHLSRSVDPVSRSGYVPPKTTSATETNQSRDSRIIEGRGGVLPGIPYSLPRETRVVAANGENDRTWPRPTLPRYVSPIGQYRNPEKSREDSLGGGAAAQAGLALTNPRGNREAPQRPKLPRPPDTLQGLGLSKVASSPQLGVQRAVSVPIEPDRTLKSLLLNGNGARSDSKELVAPVPKHDAQSGRDSEEVGGRGVVGPTGQHASFPQPWSLSVVAPLDHSMEIEL